MTFFSISSEKTNNKSTADCFRSRALHSTSASYSVRFHCRKIEIQGETTTDLSETTSCPQKSRKSRDPRAGCYKFPARMNRGARASEIIESHRSAFTRSILSTHTYTRARTHTTEQEYKRVHVRSGSSQLSQLIEKDIFHFQDVSARAVQLAAEKSCEPSRFWEAPASNAALLSLLLLFDYMMREVREAASVYWSLFTSLFLMRDSSRFRTLRISSSHASL